MEPLEPRMLLSGGSLPLTGEMAIRWEHDIGAYIADLKSADLNSDGLPDLIAGPSQDRVVAVDGSGAALWDGLTAGAPWYVAAGDITGDGLADVVGMLAQSPSIVYAFDHAGQSLWEYTLPVTGSGNQVSEHIQIADIDDDGSNEIVVGANCSGRVYAFSGNGQVEWTYDVAASAEYMGIGGLRTGDVDGDDVPDVAVCYGYSDTDPCGLVVLDGTGGVIWDYSNRERLGNVALGDLNHDGATELVTGEWYASRGEKLYAIDSTGTKLWEYTINGRINDVLVSDLDGDGDSEIVVSSWDNALRVINPDGTLRWAQSLSFDVGTVALGDTDGDGNTELICASSGGSILAYGAGGSLLWTYALETGGCSDLVVADFTGDGVDDVAAADSETLYLLSRDEPAGEIRGVI